MSDLTARARKRAEELEAKRKLAYAETWWRTDPPWGNGNTIHAGPSDDPHAASCWIAEVPIGEDDGSDNMAFIAYAANTANENAGLLTALADRVDEQERRIAELEAYTKDLRLNLASITDEYTNLHDRVRRALECPAEALSQKGGG